MFKVLVFTKKKKFHNTDFSIYFEEVSTSLSTSNKTNSNKNKSIRD